MAAKRRWGKSFCQWRPSVIVCFGHISLVFFPFIPCQKVSITKKEILLVRFCYFWMKFTGSRIVSYFWKTVWLLRNSRMSCEKTGLLIKRRFQTFSVIKFSIGTRQPHHSMVTFVVALADQGMWCVSNSTYAYSTDQGVRACHLLWWVHLIYPWSGIRMLCCFSTPDRIYKQLQVL